MVLFAACNAPVAAPKHIAEAPGTQADIVLRGVTLRNFHENELHLVATMPRLELMRESTDLAAAQVTATLASGITVTAKQVTGNANEGRIVGSDGVHFTTLSGVTGDAPSATYEKNLGPQGGAHGERGVHLEHPQFSVDARAFAFDFATEHATFDDASTRIKGRAP